MRFPAAAPSVDDGMVVFGKLEIPEGEALELSDTVIVLRLVASGVSRLSAERIVAVKRNAELLSRARRRGQSRP
jgi:hypothetical protein